LRVSFAGCCAAAALSTPIPSPT
jgi:predicted metalloprotease with PDZ domain